MPHDHLYFSDYENSLDRLIKREYACNSTSADTPLEGPPPTRRDRMLISHKASELSPRFFTEPVVMGIDEAGRGPVLGPMVYACVFVLKSDLDHLKSMAFKDSKLLKLDQRTASLATIHTNGETMCWIANPIPPYLISAGMLSKKKYNLNEISHDAAIAIIRLALSLNVNLSEVYVDTVGPPASYQKKLASLFPSLSTVDVRPKADSVFPIVSAASIVAKTLRDKLVDDWSFVERDPSLSTVGVGSGYPAGPAKTWLENKLDPVFGFPDYVRFGWSTVRLMLKKRAIKVDTHSDTEEDLPPPARNLKPNSKSLKRPSTAFSPSAPLSQGRSAYYTSRNLHLYM